MQWKHPWSWARWLIDFLVKNEWLVLVVFGVFVLRVPTLFEPNWYGDEEIYLTMGQGMRSGLVFYRDIFDHKPPLLYILAGIAGSVFWFRLMLMVVHALSLVIFARLADLVLTKRWLVMLATWVYALFSTIPHFEGTIANGENFMVVPAMMATYLVYLAAVKTHVGQKGRYFMGVGIWFAMAFLIKVPIGFDMLAAGIFWVFLADTGLGFKRVLSRLLSRQVLSWAGGFLGIIGLSVLYYAWQGALEPYVRSALLNNIGYVQSWEGAARSLFDNPLVWRGILALALTWLVVMLRFGGLVTRPMAYLSAWWIWSVYGALLSSRPYPHYLLQPLVPGVLLLAILIEKLLAWSRVNVTVGSLSVGLGAVMIGLVGFGSYPTFSYYAAFGRYATGQIDRTAYELTFPSPVAQNKAVAEYLRARTAPDERIFVWGEEPAIYTLSGRNPVGRYIVSFHIRDFPGGYEETMRALEREKPQFIVVLPSQVPSFPELEGMLQADYIPVEMIDKAVIYKRLSGTLVFFSDTI